MMIARFIAAIIVGYLLGAIPFGLLLTRRYAKVDVRKYGSGKIGATNVLRTAGRRVAIMVVALDIAKGMLAVIFAGLIVGKNPLVVHGIGFGSLSAQALAALAAVVGHNWSVFLKFRGGRGVATFFGGLAALCLPAALVGGEIVIIGAGLTQYVSLGSLAGAVGSYAVLVPLYIMNRFPVEYLFYVLVGALIIFVMHRDNIARLVTGKERKLGEKAARRTSSSGRGRGAG
jgi:glycerol-3-phosphate acyltransferase PlsY